MIFSSSGENDAWMVNSETQQNSTNMTKVANESMKEKGVEIFIYLQVSFDIFNKLIKIFLSRNPEPS